VFLPFLSIHLISQMIMALIKFHLKNI